MSAGAEIQLIAVILSAACALPGAFLVLRKMSMMSDSITHTILLGIVLAFFVTEDLSSPFLIAGAGAMGVLTVWLTETLTKTKLVSEDSAMGIVFPLLFSIAVILITRYGGGVHLDTDSVLLGELAFAPFDRFVVFGTDIGPKALYIAAALLFINGGFLLLYYKELKLATFDPILASVLGFSPGLLHYGFMTLVSLTAVGAFQAVGSVLVVAFMIGPPLTACLLTDDLKKILLLGGIFGGLGGILGFQGALYLDVSIAGGMAVAIGVLFLLAFLFAPQKGLIGSFLRRQKQKKEFAQLNLLLHVIYHQNLLSASQKNDISLVAEHLHWSKSKLERALRGLIKRNLIERKDGRLIPTKEGITYGQEMAEALLNIR